MIVGDIVPARLAAPYAALALLRFAIANGFFWAALGGLMRIFVSDYLRLKKTVGLSHYDEAAMLAKLDGRGFYGQTRAAQYRPQPAAHDVPGAAGLVPAAGHAAGRIGDAAVGALESGDPMPSRRHRA